MQVWYYTNLNQLEREYNVNNTFYVSPDTYTHFASKK